MARINDTNASGNKTRTTEKYKNITDELHRGRARLLGEQTTARAMLADKFIFNDKQARNMLAATTIQLARNAAAIRNDQIENECAYRDGTIFKFW